MTEAYQQGPVATCWPALLGFLQLSTRPGILPRPLSIDQALAVMQTWLDHPGTVQVQPTAQHAGLLGSSLIAEGHGGPLVSAAHLAALAIEHCATMLTLDRSFERFAGLRVCV